MESKTGIPHLDPLLERPDVRQALDEFASFLQKRQSGHLVFHSKEGRIMQFETTEVRKVI